MLFIGNDRAEGHHDIKLVDEDGRRLARRRLPDGVDGLATLHALIADYLPEDAETDHVVVDLGTDRGPSVQAGQDEPRGGWRSLTADRQDRHGAPVSESLVTPN